MTATGKKMTPNEPTLGDLHSTLGCAISKIDIFMNPRAVFNDVLITNAYQPCYVVKLIHRETK